MGEEGDVDSLYRAAMLYYEGKGCGAPNLQKATELLERAASYHHPEATLILDTVHRDAATQIVPANTVEQRSSQNPLSFRDVAFKKNANSEYVAEVISPYNFSHTDEGYEETTSQKDESYKWDAGLYENIKLKIIEPDFEQDPNSALESFVGLDSVKNCLKAIRAKALFEVKRQEAGLLQALPSHHFIFSGNPGTGKSEVARLMGHIFLNAGLLKKGHVVEIDRSNLVGGWIGHTALKTQAVINKAIGGVLFIDEAYSLFVESTHDNGDEAISTLLKNMEDKRGEFIVIMAGYQNKMQKLIESNPGLKSRFRNHIHFTDFTSNELVAIFKKFCCDFGYKLSAEAWFRIEQLMQEACKRNIGTLGNGRFARNVFERSLENMAQRVVQSNSDDIETIHFSDIPNAAEILMKKKASG